MKEAIDARRLGLLEEMAEQLEDFHSALVLAVRAAAPLLEHDNIVEAGGLRAAEHWIGEGIGDLRALLSTWRTDPEHAAQAGAA